MRELGAPHGVYASLGNWDRDPRPIFDGTGVELLAERSVEIIVRGAPVRVAGCGFGISPKVLGTAPPDTLNILLYHHPDFLEQFSHLGYDLVLSGHTHGGQVRLPGLGPFIHMSRSGYDAGLYTMDKTVLYVNRGLGAEGGPLPEFRLFCRPEVTVLDVKSKKKSTQSRPRPLRLRAVLSGATARPAEARRAKAGRGRGDLLQISFQIIEYHRPQVNHLVRPRTPCVLFG